MTGLEGQLAAAFLLDLLIGDPRFLPHPVRLVGAFALHVEHLLRRWQRLPLRAAGIAAVIVIVGSTVGVAQLLLMLCGLVHPLLEWWGGVMMLYFCFAARDLAGHASAVTGPLQSGDLERARECVGMIVGRDTATMDESEVSLAAVESVAENTVDGVTAPLLFGMLFGPIGAVAYKAVNTLDSMFGYRNERYCEFGWAAARLDDLVNYLPSRLTVPVIALAAFFMRLRSAEVLPSVVRTARLHASPNAGYPEAAYAGALGMRFGGPRSYGGIQRNLPFLGIRHGACSIQTVREAVRLMMVTSFLFLMLGIGIRLVMQAVLTQ